jgi:hypothetical protein
MKDQFSKLIQRGTKLWNSKSLGWNPGMAMSLLNSNGDVDVSTLGYQYTIQTTSQIRAQVVHQKFYEIPFADYVPVIPGTGAWMEDIKTNLVYDTAGAFDTGVISLASSNNKLAQVDVGISPVSAKIATWAKGYQYSIPEVKKALASNNWDVVSSKMEALKRNWDIGIQKVAFLGFSSDLTNLPGLLTNANVNSNTSLIPSNISAMSSATFATLVAGILAAYFANSNNTVLPDTFEIPMDDYLGLTVPVASGFPVVSQLTYLENAFKQATQNPNFMIYGLAYGTAANNAGYITAGGKSRYVLYRNDPETIKMDLPVDFILTPAGTSNNFQFQGVGAGQFTGAIAYRPAEILYFDHS